MCDSSTKKFYRLLERAAKGDLAVLDIVKSGSHDNNLSQDAHAKADQGTSPSVSVSLATLEELDLEILGIDRLIQGLEEETEKVKRRLHATREQFFTELSPFDASQRLGSFSHLQHQLRDESALADGMADLGDDPPGPIDGRLEAGQARRSIRDDLRPPLRQR